MLADLGQAALTNLRDYFSGDGDIRTLGKATMHGEHAWRDSLVTPEP